MKLEFFITIDTDTQEFSVVNKATGESKTLPVVKKSSKKQIVEECNIPQLTLEDSKYILNSAAVELLKVEAGSRLDIKFDTNGNPVIGTDESFGTPGAGNLLTKSNSVRYSGNNNARLSEFGKVFEIQPHPVNVGIFLLKGDKLIETKVEDPNVEIPDDFDLAELVELGDEKLEVRGLDFNLN